MNRWIDVHFQQFDWLSNCNLNQFPLDSDFTLYFDKIFLGQMLLKALSVLQE